MAAGTTTKPAAPHALCTSQRFLGDKGCLRLCQIGNDLFYILAGLGIDPGATQQVNQHGRVAPGWRQNEDPAGPIVIVQHVAF